VVEAKAQKLEAEARERMLVGTSSATPGMRTEGEYIYLE
jgi:hypothetical protein